MLDHHAAFMGVKRRSLYGLPAFHDPMPACRAQAAFHASDFAMDPHLLATPGHWSLDSPLLPSMSAMSAGDETRKRRMEPTDDNGPTEPETIEQHCAKRQKRPPSQPKLPSPALQVPADVDAALQLSSAQQQLEFLRHENDALREQHLQQTHMTNKVMMENQLLRGIMWSYMQLVQTKRPSPIPSGTDEE